MPTERSFHVVKGDGRDVELRVFVPDKTVAAGKATPAVVMVCGLLWLGNGFLGRIGLAFNDAFGYVFAKSGAPCVQIHTPSRHIACTLIMDIAVLFLWPLGFVPILNMILLLADWALLTKGDISEDVLLLLSPIYAWLFGPLALPALHLSIRATHWFRGFGIFDTATPPCHQVEIAAAVAWAEEHQADLGSDGRLVLCGYSSGGHCASLYGLAAPAKKFEAVVLISGIYGLRTTWSGQKAFLAPIFNTLYRNILGLDSAERREANSPDVAATKLAKQALEGQKWYLLTAQSELLGLQPFQDILFSSGPLRDALEDKGATVKEVTCGHNHWLLIMNIAGFVEPFCKSMLK